jgi:hypothetical protein
MLWLIAAAMLVVLVWTFTSGRKYGRSAHDSAAVSSHSTVRNIHALDRFLGLECIYEKSAQLCKVRVMQIEPDQHEVRFTFAVLDADGLDRLDDDQIFLNARWPTISFSDTFLHAHYVNWKLYADPGLVRQICEEARLGVPPRALLKTLLHYRMQHV